MKVKIIYENEEYVGLSKCWSLIVACATICWPPAFGQGQSISKAGSYFSGIGLADLYVCSVGSKYQQTGTK